jgi:hypothetical protein
VIFRARFTAEKQFSIKGELSPTKRKSMQEQGSVAPVRSPAAAEMSYDACVTAFRVAARNVERYREATEALDSMLTGTKELPIVSFPLGVCDDAGQHIVVEVDLRTMIRQLAESAADAEQLKAHLLRPYRAYFYRRYIQAVTDARYAAEVLAGLLAALGGT